MTDSQVTERAVAALESLSSTMVLIFLKSSKVQFSLNKFRLNPINEFRIFWQLIWRKILQKIHPSPENSGSKKFQVSSLERSLEMAAAHSDGLSDKEAKLKEVQTTFKLTHRRTSSVRIYDFWLKSMIFYSAHPFISILKLKILLFQIYKD